LNFKGTEDFSSELAMLSPPSIEQLAALAKNVGNPQALINEIPII